MKKGFMMIELSLIILGIFLLSNLTFKVLQYGSEIDFTYEFIKISKKCDIECSIKKLIP